MGQRGPENILVGQSKNGERREVPINGAVREALSGIVRGVDSTYVFCDKKGDMFKGARNAFERACKRAGIYNFRFHDLRHSAASFMAMAGVDLMAIKQVLGHKTIAMTVRYSHLLAGPPAERRCGDRPGVDLSARLNFTIYFTVGRFPRSGDRGSRRNCLI